MDDSRTLFDPFFLRRLPEFLPRVHTEQVSSHRRKKRPLAAAAAWNDICRCQPPFRSFSVFSTRTPFREYLQLKIIIRRIFLRKSRSSFEIRPSHLFSALGIIPKKGVADFVQSSLLSHRPAKIPSLFYAREARRATNSKDVAGVPLMR